MYSYNFGKETGDYKITNIPYGTYEVIGQKIGIDNGISEIVTIDPFNNQITGIMVNFNVTGVEDEQPIIPDETILFTNYPNPFNPVTRIKFVLSENELTSLRVYNLIGQEVAVLVNSNLAAGSYEVSFNAENLSSGIYFYTLQVGKFKQTKKMLLLK